MKVIISLLDPTAISLLPQTAQVMFASALATSRDAIKNNKNFIVRWGRRKQIVKIITARKMKVTGLLTSLEFSSARFVNHTANTETIR